MLILTEKNTVGADEFKYCSIYPFSQLLCSDILCYPLSPVSERMVQAVFKKSVVLIFCNFLIL